LDSGVLPSSVPVQRKGFEGSGSRRNVYYASSAVTWGDGYTFPQSFLTDGAACLAEAGVYFEVMVRNRLDLLARDRLSASRVEGLRSDNPERRLMFDLVIGMKAFVPEGFVANGSLPRTPLQKKYVTIAISVNF
jgi:hypothetical protein